MPDPQHKWPAEVVEAVARSLYLHDWDYPEWMPETDDLPAYMDQARAALDAMEPHVQELEAVAWEWGYSDGAVHAVSVRAEFDGLSVRSESAQRPPNPYRVNGGDHDRTD